MTDVLLEALRWSPAGDLRQQRTYAAAFVLLTVGTLLCLLPLVVARLARLDVLAVALASGGTTAWLLSNGPVEGRILLTLLPGNGVTVADVLAVPAVLLGSVLCWRRLHAR